MKMEKENRKIYKDTFDEVHASENLLRKVKDMKKENINRVKRISKKAVCAAAALVVAGFVSSNAIAYAATGSTWVHKVKLSLDGMVYDVEVMKEDENTMRVEVNNAEGELPKDFYITTQNDALNPEDGTVIICDGSTGVYLELEGERLYLVSGADKIDITDNFNGGICEGDMEIDGKTYHYTVTDNGVYSLSIVEK